MIARTIFPGAGQMAAEMSRCLDLFAAGFGRQPTEDEAQILWAAVQRWNGVPERKIEPSEMRRQ